jgi:hypothetical protein
MIQLLARDEIKARILLIKHGIMLESHEDGYIASDHEKACEILKDNYILYYAD